MLDLTAEFYLETVRLVFQEHRLPTGSLDWRGRRVEPPEGVTLLAVAGYLRSSPRLRRPALR